jgi:uncharacterized protein (DUF58 family)
MIGYLDTVDQLTARQFVLAVKKLADGLSFGSDKSPFLGSGIEYAQSRPYQWGDPVRCIDWRVTARAGKVYVKEYEAPKRMPCFLLIDTSASMAVSSFRRSKYAVAVHLAGGIALASLERMSPVGVLGVGGRDFRIEPSLSKVQILEWMHRLRKYRFDEPTSLGRKITELAPSLTTRAIVIVLSDMHDPSAMQALKLMAQRHECAVLQLRDPAEDSLRGAGLLRAREAETGREVIAVGRRVGVDAEALAAELRRSGIDHLVVRIDRPYAESVRRFFRGRDLLGRGVR